MAVHSPYPQVLPFSFSIPSSWDRSVWPCLTILGTSTWYHWVINPAQTAGLGALEYLGLANIMEHQGGFRGARHGLWDLGWRRGTAGVWGFLSRETCCKQRFSGGSGSWPAGQSQQLGNWLLAPQKVKTGVALSLPRPGKAVGFPTQLGLLGNIVSSQGRQKSHRHLARAVQGNQKPFPLFLELLSGIQPSSFLPLGPQTAHQPRFTDGPVYPATC